MIDLEETKDSLSWVHGIIRKEHADALLVRYNTANGAEKEKIWQEIQVLLEMRKNLRLFSEHPLSRAPTKTKASDGIFTIGTVINAGKELYPFSVSEDFFYKHVLQTAGPSHGKSTHISAIKSELVKNDVAWVSLDSKSDYAGLVKIHPEILIVDAQGDLRFNIFEAPPGVEPKVWRSLVIDATSHSFGYGHGVKGYLQKAIDVITDERGDDFHIGHVYEVIKGWSESSRVSQDYRDVLLSRLELVNECKDVFWCKNSMPFERIKWLIIRTHKVSVEVHSLIFEILLLREFIFRLFNNIKDEAAELKVFFVDEAGKTSLAESREKDWTAREISTPTITKFLTMARQFHLGVWASDQLYSALSESLKAISASKVIGRLNTGSDINAVSKDLMLDEEKETIHKLQTGEWVVRTAKINKPFMIRSADAKIPGITEEEIEAHMAGKRFWLQKEKEVERIKKSVSSTLSQDEWYLLNSINLHPFTALSNRLRQGMGKGRLELAKHSLIEKSLITERTVKIGAYRPLHLLELTQDGINLLASVGHNTAFWRHIKHEGIEHVMYKYFISDKLKQLGFEPLREHKIEVDGGYRVVDIYFEDNGKKVGIEIECSTADIENKAIALQVLDIIVLAYSTEEILLRTKEWLAQHGELNQKVRLVLLSDYLKELQSLIRRDANRLNSNHRTKADSGSDGTKGGLK